MRIKILRRQAPDSEAYWESFSYTGPREISVAALLEHLNARQELVNEAGQETSRISWDCSCLQGVCGACAMVINGTPALACETFLKDLPEKELVLRPLSKFPIVRDLMVDRSSIHENLKRANVTIGEYDPKPGEDHRQQYESAKCLKCGLCLEVCPNYTSGEHFYGALFVNDCYLVSSRSRQKAKQIRQSYGEHFGSGCSKSLSCMDVCPMQLPLLRSMAKLNR